MPKVFVVLWNCSEGPNCDVFASRDAILNAYNESVTPALDTAERTPGEAIDLGWADDEDLIVRFMSAQ